MLDYDPRFERSVGLGADTIVRSRRKGNADISPGPKIALIKGRSLRQSDDGHIVFAAIAAWCELAGEIPLAAGRNWKNDVLLTKNCRQFSFPGDDGERGMLACRL
jgi:hypothetical protein